MGTIADKLTYLNGTKTAIKDAIVAKGVSVSDADTFRSYATKISEISGGGGGGSEKYGVTIDDMLGNVDESSVLQSPMTTYSFNSPDASDIGSRVLFGKFAGTGVKNVYITIPSISGDEAMSYAFAWCNQLEVASFKTQYIDGNMALRYCFQRCGMLLSVEFTGLERVGGKNTFNYCFRGCSALERVDFPMLTQVVDTAAFNSCFSGCAALKEIHFRADAQSIIEGLTGYDSKWGAPSSTIYFDL